MLTKHFESDVKLPFWKLSNDGVNPYIFNVQIEYIEKPFKFTNFHGTSLFLCVLGDAAVTPHFLTRSGVNVGYDMVKLYLNYIMKEKTLTEVEKEFDKLKKTLIERARGEGPNAFDDAHFCSKVED